GDHHARHTRIRHALHPPRDTGGDGGRPDVVRHRPGGLERGLRAPSLAVQPDVGGPHGPEGVGGAHDGLPQAAIPGRHGAAARAPGSRGGVARPRTSCRDAMRYGLSSGNGISVTLVLSIAWNAAGSSSRAGWIVWPDFHRTKRKRLPPSFTMMPFFSNSSLVPIT